MGDVGSRGGDAPRWYDGTPLTGREFAVALRRGHGRAILHLRDHGLGDYRRLLVQRVRKPNGFDHQIVGFHTRYLREIIRLVDADGALRQTLWEDLRRTDDDRTRSHLMYLAADFAKLGDENARRAIWANIDRLTSTNRGSTPPRTFLATEGMPLVEAWFGEYWRQHGGDTEREWWSLPIELDRLAPRFGTPETITEELRSSRTPGVRELIERVEQEAARRAEIHDQGPPRPPGPPGSPSPTSREEAMSCARRAIATGNHDRKRACLHWLEHEDLVKLLREALRFTDRPRLADGVLTLMWWSDKTRFDPLVLECAQAGVERRTRCRALDVLARRREPDVREAMLRAIAELPPGRLSEGWLELLAAHFEPGDEALLERVLALHPVVRYVREWIIKAVIPIVEARHDAALTPGALRVYDELECSHCRETMFKLLVARAWAPDDLVREAAFDCDFGTRLAARRELRRRGLRSGTR